MSTGFESSHLTSDPTIPPALHEVLAQYSNVPVSELVTHVKNVRDKAWLKFQYPCIGLYAFLRLNASTLSSYPAVVERMKEGDRLLDLGCCLGQETRKLVFDGAPSENIVGMDLEGAFIEYGYDLFLDRDRLASKFWVGDIFDLDKSRPVVTTTHVGREKTSLAPGASTSVSNADLGRFDIIMAIYLVHLFSYDDQVRGLTILVTQLLKIGSYSPGKPCLIFGLRLGTTNPRVIPHSTAAKTGETFGHNAESWTKLVEEVQERCRKEPGEEMKGLKLEVGAKLGEPMEFMNRGNKGLGDDFRFLEWCIWVRRG